LVLLGVAGCGAGAGAVAVGPVTAVRPAAGAGVAAEAGCRAWAEDVSLTGRVRWQTPLATQDAAGTSAADPLDVGGVAVVAEDATVHGLRVGTGRPLWSYPAGQPVTGMWQWHDLVVVLTGEVGDIVPLGSDGRLIGLDAATGAGARPPGPVPSPPRTAWCSSVPARG